MFFLSTPKLKRVKSLIMYACKRYITGRTSKTGKVMYKENIRSRSRQKKLHKNAFDSHRRSSTNGRYNGETNGICESTCHELFSPFYVPLLSILHQSLVSQGDVLGSLVRALANEPPDADEDGKATGHQTGVVHRGSLGGQGVGEAEDDNKGDDVDARQGVDNIANLVVHEEESGNEGRAAGENVGEDGHEIGKTGQLHEASNESTEGGSRAEVNASENRYNATAHQGGIEGVLEGAVDVAQPVGEWGGTVARNGP